MSLLYLLEALGTYTSHPSAPLQAPQRDWSPFLVHFTSASAMSKVWKNAYQSYGKNINPSTLSKDLKTADSASFEIFKKIIRSGIVQGTQLQDTTGGRKVTSTPVVCLTECSLPGLLGHSERFGRYGLVFEKKELFQKCDARPCPYVDSSTFQKIQDSSHQDITNVFSRYEKSLPNGWTPLDYTHEREWRARGDIDLSKVTLKTVLVPTRQDVVSTLQELKNKSSESGFASLQDALLFPLKTLFQWGA
jgi:hypothetical protein